MSDTDSLSGISFYLDDSIFALASPATHARSTLSTTVSSLSLLLSLLLSFPFRCYPPLVLLLPSGLSFTRIHPLLPLTLPVLSRSCPRSRSPSSIFRCFLLRLSAVFLPWPVLALSPSWPPLFPVSLPGWSPLPLHVDLSSLSTKYAIYPRASHHRTRSRHD